MRINLSAAALSALLLASAGTARADLTGPDRDFATRAMQDNVAEINKAQWAEKAQSPQPVKELAQKIIKNRSTANAKLRTIAANQQFTLPSLPSSDQQHDQANLRDTKVQDIKAAYSKEEIAAHQQQIALYQRQIDQGKNAELRDFAREFLPVLQDELKSAQTVQQGG